MASTEGATPVALPEPPLSRAAAARPGYQESATFFLGEDGPIGDSGSAVVLARPGFVEEGRVMGLPPTDAGVAVVRAGGIDGIEVTATAADSADALGLAREVIESLQRL